MTERYTRVYTMESSQYQIHAPVIVAAGALLKDNTNNTVLAQLKFKNVSDKIIKALKVSIQPLNVKGEKLGSEVEYQYLDLSAKRDDEFGQKAPIQLPDNNSRQFSVRILESLFVDNTEWKANSFELVIISEEKPLADVLHNDSDLIEQFRIECGEMNKVMPVFHNAYWICSCGAFNKNDETVCHTCYKEKTVLTKLNLEDLEEKKEIRLKNEAYDRAIAFAQEDTVDSLTKAVETMSGLSDWKDAEEKVKEYEIRIKDLTYEEAVSLSKQDTVDSLKKAQTMMTGLSGWKNADEEAANYGQRIESLTAKDKADKAAKKKKIIIVSSVLCAIIAIVLVYIQFILPGQKYNEAIALMEDKKYEEALTIFAGLNGYEDSNAKIDECNKEIAYLSATELMENGNYSEAYSKFQQLDGYKDSDEKMDLNFNENLKNVEVGSTISFGDIDWRVLAKEENKVLVITEDSIGKRTYNTVEKDVTWETCTLRNWLNTSFYNETFSEFEKSKILTTTVKTEKNPKYDANPGNNTEDKIFLLSVQEAEKYFASNSERRIDDWWWLRSPGISNLNAAVVDNLSFYDGDIDFYGDYVSNVDGAVRPALWLEIE